MTRHGKNATASAVYTYHERMKDTKDGNYGTQKTVITRDSARNFDCCCLTLQPCIDPVVTPDGYLFEREAILQNLLKQKKKIAKLEKAYNKQLTEEAPSSGASDSRTESFLKEQLASSAIKHETKNKSVESSQKLNNFWVPSLQGHATKQKLQKPKAKTVCPISGKNLKLKDLTNVKFTPMPQGDSKSLICQDNRFMCAVTSDVLTNFTACVVLKTSGSVVTLDCYDNLIKKDMLDPISNTKLSEKDVIFLKRGATGYAGASNTGEGLVAEKKTPTLMAS